MFLELEQGSDEWLYVRRSHVTATDAAKIMGISPWGTPNDVFLDKMGEAPPFITNPAVEFGRKMEPAIREYYEDRTGETFDDTVVSYDSWALASLDGINESKTKILEIKTCGEKAFGDAKWGVIPKYYMSQAQFQLFCVPSAQCVEFVFYNRVRDEYAYVTVKRNEIYIQDMIEQCKEFYETCIVKKIPPALTEKDSLDLSDNMDWMALAYEALKIYMEFKEADKRWKEHKTKFLECSDDGSCHGGGIKLYKSWRTGGLDTEKMGRDGIDVEKYRKSPTSSMRVTVEKNKGLKKPLHV